MSAGRSSSVNTALSSIIATMNAPTVT